MSGRLKLEVFDSTEEPRGDETVVTDNAALEDLKLTSFEQGYKAGWDDAMTAQSEDQARIGADLARNLQALSFTYHEARAQILRAVGPLIEEMAARVLPQVAQMSLVPMIAEALEAAAETAAEVPVEVLINPAMRAAVAQLLQSPLSLPVTLVDEPTLGEGQAYLRFGDAEERIDLDGALAAIQSATADFFTPPSEEERQHG